MPKQKIKVKAEDQVEIKEEESSLAEFTKRPVPSEKEVESFEQAIGEDTSEEGKAEEIEESLNEIYTGDDGKKVNVKELFVKKSRGLVFWLLTTIIAGTILFAIGYALYYYYFHGGTDSKSVEFTISGETEVVSGKEIIYTLEYRNNSRVSINDIRMEVKYPDNFVFVGSEPASENDSHTVWILNNLGAYNVGKVEIKGMLIGKEEERGVILADLRYTPENFSSGFKKSAAITTAVKDIGIEFEVDSFSTALVGDENEILLRFLGKEENYINNFRVVMEPNENLEIVEFKNIEKYPNLANYEMTVPGSWKVASVTKEELVLPMIIKYKQKPAEKQTIKLAVQKEVVTENESRYFTIFEHSIEQEVMDSDLNLTLISNGSREDQGIEFGKTLNYSIVYKNKGETEMRDVAIMVVLNSDWLDWDSLKDGLGGKVHDNAIIWTKEEIPALGLLTYNQEGTIDFSINVKNKPEIIDRSAYEITAHAQFSAGGVPVDADTDNKSNTIVSRINSFLELDESIRYFSEDNVPVGSGPNPPKVDEKTTYKVYWNLNNSLHELKDISVEMVLPEYMRWEGKENVSTGSINYNSDQRKITWTISRLPVSISTADASFDISLTPDSDDRNKILVLIPGTTVKAVDSVTEAELTDKTSAKTTKLEDDDIGRSDGMVE